MFTGHTICIRYDEAIRPNTNRLFGPLFGTEANTNRIFGASLIENDFPERVVTLSTITNNGYQVTSVMSSNPCVRIRAIFCSNSAALLLYVTLRMKLFSKLPCENSIKMFYFSVKLSCCDRNLWIHAMLKVILELKSYSHSDDDVCAEHVSPHSAQKMSESMKEYFR